MSGNEAVTAADDVHRDVAESDLDQHLDEQRISALLALTARVAALVPAISATVKRRDDVTRLWPAVAAAAISLAELVLLARRLLNGDTDAIPYGDLIDTAGTVTALTLAGQSGDPMVVSSFAVGLVLGSSAYLGLTAPLASGLVGTSASAAVATFLAKRGKTLSSWEPVAAASASFFLAGRAVRNGVRRNSERLERLARRRADDRRRLEGMRTELAVQRERETQHRLIHQHALQVLEMVAGDWELSPECLRAHAERESEYLRRVIAGDDPQQATGGLATELRGLVEYFAPLGLAVSLDLDPACGEPAPAPCAALVHAAREALTNVRKHAGVDTVRLSAGPDGTGGVVVLVVDEGIGFDAATPGSGLRRDVLSLMETVGGRAALDSSPGGGTRVTLKVPGR